MVQVDKVIRLDMYSALRYEEMVKARESDEGKDRG